MFIYAIMHSHSELQKAIQSAEKDFNNDEVKKEVNFRTGSFLHWIIDYYEWLERTYDIQLGPDEKAFFSGLRYANNKLKHDPEIIQLYDCTGGVSFPISFPLYIEAIRYVWKNIPCENSSQWENQHKNYLTYVSNKEILMVAHKALKILNIIQ